MATFAPPLGVNAGLQGMTAPLAPLPADQIAAGALAGATIRGGNPFTDTQPGVFYPVVIDALGNVTLNSSVNHLSSLVFHDSKNGGTDTLLVSVGSKIIGVAPNSAADGGLTFTVYRDNTLGSAVWSVFRVGGNYSAVQIEGQTTWIGNATRGTQVISVKTGVPVDGDFPQPTAGMLVWDDTDSKLYVRTLGGTWKSVALA